MGERIKALTRFEASNYYATLIFPSTTSWMTLSLLQKLVEALSMNE